MGLLDGRIALVTGGESGIGAATAKALAAEGAAVADPQILAAAREHIPWGRAGWAEEVASLAVFLCSDKADYMTGAVLTIDGGLTLEQALGA